MSFLRLLALPLAALVASVSAPVGAANPFDPSDEEDRVAIEALALYPEDVRDQILEASTEAGLLRELESLQERSKRSFRELLESYPQDDQQDLFDLSRYPDLIAAIAEGGPKSRGELERIAARYPEDVRAAVLRQGGPRYRVIVRMHALLDQFDDRFHDLVAPLPPRKAEAFRALLGAPEVLSLLTEHSELTVLLGDAYERAPQETRERFADLNLEVARRNAEEAKDWKASVDADPDLRRDYENAARDYQADTGYGAYSPPRTTVNVVVNPYPFWVGYPWWYPVSYNYYDPWYWWYPRPSWGYVGWGWGPRFYTGFGVGPVWRPWYPTPFFTSWYFSAGFHHARYPYLTDHYVSYYDRPVVVNNVKVVNNNYYYNKRVVKKFVHETDRVVSRDFLHGSRKDRVNRIRDYGKVAPELEKVQLEARRKELAKHGRADRMRVPERSRDVDHAGTQKAAGEILRKHEKEAPALAGFAREPRAADGAAEVRRGKDRSRAAAADTGTPGAASGGKRERGRTAASVEPRVDGTGDGERGKARAASRSSEPGATRVSPTVGESVRKKSGKSGDGARQGTSQRDAAPSSRERDGGSGGERSAAKAERRAVPAAPKASPERSAPREPQLQTEREPERTRSSAPRVERSRGGGGGGGGGGHEAQSSQPPPEPRASSGGGGGGGGGGGKNKSKAEKDAEEQDGGSDGGGGGGRHR